MFPGFAGRGNLVRAVSWPRGHGPLQPRLGAPSTLCTPTAEARLNQDGDVAVARTWSFARSRSPSSRRPPSARPPSRKTRHCSRPRRNRMATGPRRVSAANPTPTCASPRSCSWRCSATVGRAPTRGATGWWSRADCVGSSRSRTRRGGSGMDRRPCDRNLRARRGPAGCAALRPGSNRPDPQRDRRLARSADPRATRPLVRTPIVGRAVRAFASGRRQDAGHRPRWRCGSHPVAR